MTEGVYDLSDPVDTAEYEAWLDSQLDGASEMELPYLSLTEEHIRQRREE